MAEQTPQQGESESEYGSTTGASSMPPLAENKVQHRHNFVRRNAATGVTWNMTLATQ